MSIYLILSLVGAAVFSLGVAAIVLRFGIPPSLSETFYLLGGRKGKGFIFYLWLAVVVFVMLIPMVQAAGFWGFICGVGLLFVGAAPAFKKEDDEEDKGSIEPIIHPIAALLSAFSAVMQLVKIREWGWMLVSAFFAWCVAYVTMTMRKSYIFWLEMAAFYGLFAGMIVHYLKM